MKMRKFPLPSLFSGVFFPPPFGKLWSAVFAQEVAHSQKGDPSKFRAAKFRWKLGRANGDGISKENSMYFVIPKCTYISNHSNHSGSSPGFFSISKAPKHPTQNVLEIKTHVFFYPSYGERVERSIFRREQALLISKKNDFTTRGFKDAQGCPGVCPGVRSPQNAKK